MGWWWWWSRVMVVVGGGSVATKIGLRPNELCRVKMPLAGASIPLLCRGLGAQVLVKAHPHAQRIVDHGLRMKGEIT
jgi:hypothetical protein